MSLIRKIICMKWLPVTLLVLVLGGGESDARESKEYVLATATTAGTYYPVGVALSTLTKVKLEPEFYFSLNAIRSAGSAENLAMMKDNRVQFAILQGLYGYWAKNGTGPFAEEGPRTQLRSITMLWRNVEHFVMKSDYLRTGTIADLVRMKGKRLSIGSKDSGTAGSGLHLLTELGFAPERDFRLVHAGYGQSAEAMLDGMLEAMNVPAGPPVEAVGRVFLALGKDITVLEFTPEQLERVNRKYDLWTPYTIAPNTYPGQDKEINTIAQPNFLAVRADVPDEDVYRIVKTIYENLDFLRAIHPITGDMTVEAAIDGLPVPLHPGAARFYREYGVEIPDNLIAR